MATADRAFDRGTRQGERWIRTLGEEFRIARLTLGLSQKHVAQAARTSRPVYSRVERGALPHLRLMLAAQIAAVLGLELSARAHPGGGATRDTAHGERLGRLLAHVGPPLRFRTEVPLPRTTGYPELRSWDALIIGHGERTAVELEMRLFDAQAQVRRIHLKQRDDPPDRLLLVVADTRANRRALSESAEEFANHPRLRTANVLLALRAGQQPPTGLIVL